jgi:hypothetical protein
VAKENDILMQEAAWKAREVSAGRAEAPPEEDDEDEATE